jgi:hypothetical protein
VKKCLNPEQVQELYREGDIAEDHCSHAKFFPAINIK